MPRTKKTKLDPKTAERRERFSRIFPARVEKMVKNLDLLCNCSNKSSYDWTPDLVQRAWIEIAKTLQTGAKSFGLNLIITLDGKNIRDIDTKKKIK